MTRSEHQRIIRAINSLLRRAAVDKSPEILEELREAYQTAGRSDRYRITKRINVLGFSEKEIAYIHGEEIEESNNIQEEE
jgi:hypothetical protein